MSRSERTPCLVWGKSTPLKFRQRFTIANIDLQALLNYLSVNGGRESCHITQTLDHCPREIVSCRSFLLLAAGPCYRSTISATSQFASFTWPTVLHVRCCKEGIKLRRKRHRCLAQITHPTSRMRSLSPKRRMCSNTSDSVLKRLGKHNANRGTITRAASRRKYFSGQYDRSRQRLIEQWLRTGNTIALRISGKTILRSWFARYKHQCHTVGPLRTFHANGTNRQQRRAYEHKV